MLTECSNCPTWEWCQRHGCLAFNPASRQRFTTLSEQVARDNALMDEIEAALTNAEPE